MKAMKSMRIIAVKLIWIALILTMYGHTNAAQPPYFACSFGRLNPAEMYPTDVAVDNDNRVYIVDELNRRIHIRDESNNLLNMFGDYGNDDGRFIFPRGIALDQDRNIYVTDGVSGRVQKFNNDGQFIRVWEIGYPIGIAINNTSGRIYIADIENVKIQVFDTDGTFLFSWGEIGTVGGQMLKPYYIAIDDHQNVWVTDERAHRIIKYDANGNHLLDFGQEGQGIGEFVAPSGIAVDQNNNVYVYDRWNSRIQKFDQNGNFLNLWGEYGNEDGQMHGLGLCKDSNDNIYLADYWNYRIQKFSSSGQFSAKWSGTVTPDGEFAWVHDLIVHSNGDIYVVDKHNQNVQVFDPAGTFLFKWGSRGKRDWQGPYFNFPRALSADSHGNIFISNDRDIRAFDAQGTFLSYWIVSGDQLPGPLGMVIDKDDHMFIATRNHEVIKSDLLGNTITQWGTRGAGPGQFNLPIGIGADSTGCIYVSDAWNRRIQKFTNDGDFLFEWGGYGTGDGEFLKPTGLAVDSQDCVYVVDERKAQVQKFDAYGNFLTKWGQFGNGNGEFNHPQYIAVDNTGNHVYVTDTYNGRVQKFTYEPSPDIKANGSDGPVEIGPDDTLSVTIELAPGNYPGYPADWWVLADAPFGWYYYDADTEGWLPGFMVSYQGPLIELTPPVEVLNTSDLPTGGYIFYFGVDGSRNGNLDEPLYYDSVEVNITLP